jgi:hypothetical protein
LEFFLPNLADTLLTGYTGPQLAACRASEKGIWSFFVQNDMLYSTDPSFTRDYLNEGPGTPALGEQAPGNIGQFCGWQIVKKWMQKQQDLLAPSRERESAMLANQLSNTGRTGLSVAQGGGLLSANPEASALANARALQDLTLASQATQEGRNATNFYGGLFGTAGNLTSQYGQGLSGGFAPFNAGIATGTTLEGLAQNPLDVGINIGAKGMSPGAANSLLYGGLNAASTMQGANAYNQFANVLQGASTNPALGSAINQYRQPYQQAQGAMNQYGASNVYGYGGQGAQPTAGEWSNQWNVDGGI